MQKSTTTDVIVPYFDLLEDESFEQAYLDSTEGMSFWYRAMTLYMIRRIEKKSGALAKNHIYRVRTINPRNPFGMFHVKIRTLD